MLSTLSKRPQRHSRLASSRRAKLGIYRMTIASTWYDKRAGAAREFEMHFKVARRGKIRNVRRRLAQRGTPFFQRTLYRQFRRWIPKRKIRISFEREEPAAAVQRNIVINIRGMRYRGKQWKATPLPSRMLPYAKKKTKRKSAKRKRA